jgi:hypothetical protein
MGTHRLSNDMTESLYKDRKFKSWTILRLAEVSCEEWSDLNPQLVKGRMSYGMKVTSIMFKGEVNVTLDIMRQRYPEENVLQVVFGLSLSPNPEDLTMHVLNTFDFSDFVGLSSKLSDINYFSIPKTAPWEGSVFQQTAQVSHGIIESMLSFESCFCLLTEEHPKVREEVFDMRSLEMTQHLIKAKAFRLAEIYGHPEKLDDAIAAMKRNLETNEPVRQRVERVAAIEISDTEDWLYTNNLIKRLHK